MTMARASKPVTGLERVPPAVLRVALLGNPNTGKTTLFNRLSGLRHHTSNFPGTTQDARVGVMHGTAGAVHLVDLPGVYSLELEQTEAELCRRVLAGTLAPAGQAAVAPDAVCIVVDSTNLARNLVLVGEALRRRLPTVVVLNMMDLARRRGLGIDTAVLERVLGCRVISASARSGEGLDTLGVLLEAAAVPNVTPPGSQEGLEDWADELAGAASSGTAGRSRTGGVTDRLDRALTHPVGGVLVFAVVMFALFWSIFSLAQLPMELIETVFGAVSAWVQAALPSGVLGEFLSGGVVNGIGATVVFIPQICLLFFLISLLEDTGYLARAAFVMDRWLRPFGLSGHAFVPLLSSHACAIPGIMACRAVPDRRDRLATILVAPFMSCSARIPVYVLLAVVLFPNNAVHKALAFTGCYVAGLLAGLFSALLARRTLLAGAARPMALELPGYKLPSVRTALMTAYDRGLMFLRKAGTNILAICIVLWWLSAYPRSEPPPRAAELRRQAEVSPADAQTLNDEADALTARSALSHSFAGRMGRAVQPAFAPLGFDWQLTVGVMTSFAAREVFVSTMTVLVTGHDDSEGEGILTELAGAKRDDGVTPIFTPATSWALLVYYVLAMQCLPTLAVTAREAGGVKWALLQLGWMSLLAYAGGWAAFLIAGGGS